MPPEAYNPAEYFKPIIDAIYSEHERYPWTIVVVSEDAGQSYLDFQRFRREVLDTPVLPNHLAGISQRGEVQFVDGSRILFESEVALRDRPDKLQGLQATVVYL